MESRVWISEVFTDYQLGNKMGLRWKYPGTDWSAPQHILDTPTDQEIARFRAYRSGISSVRRRRFRFSPHL